LDASYDYFTQTPSFRTKYFKQVPVAECQLASGGWQKIIQSAVV
jgi:hypothetical protein